MNFFSSKSAAARYTQGRVYFHPLVIERVVKFLGLNESLERALDVGCGTGLSTVALAKIARQVIGADASAEMVALAMKDERIEYLVADALKLPFADSRFELLTLSQAFHWLDRENFLAEAKRVLRPSGYLIVYDNYFSAEMKENSEFQVWFLENYHQRYPQPPRTRPAFEIEDAGNRGFRLLGKEQYENSVSFSLAGLIDYLVTHSNVIAAVEVGGEEIAETRRWLKEKIKPFFGEAEERTLIFRGPIWYLQKPALD